MNELRCPVPNCRYAALGGNLEGLVEMVQRHAQMAHNVELTRKEVLG